MSYKPILIVAGQPNSIFLEIFFKTIKTKKFKSPLILICSKKLLLENIKKLKFKKKIKILNSRKFEFTYLNNKFINLIDVEYYPKKNSKETNRYIRKTFEIAFKIIKRNVTNKLINGRFLKKIFE